MVRGGRKDGKEVKKNGQGTPSHYVLFGIKVDLPKNWNRAKKQKRQNRAEMKK